MRDRSTWYNPKSGDGLDPSPLFQHQRILVLGPERMGETSEWSKFAEAIWKIQDVMWIQVKSPFHRGEQKDLFLKLVEITKDQPGWMPDCVLVIGNFNLKKVGMAVSKIGFWQNKSSREFSVDNWFAKDQGKLGEENMEWLAKDQGKLDTEAGSWINNVTGEIPLLYVQSEDEGLNLDWGHYDIRDIHNHMIHQGIRWKTGGDTNFYQIPAWLSTSSKSSLYQKALRRERVGELALQTMIIVFQSTKENQEEVLRLGNSWRQWEEHEKSKDLLHIWKILIMMQENSTGESSEGQVLQEILTQEIGMTLGMAMFLGGEFDYHLLSSEEQREIEARWNYPRGGMIAWRNQWIGTKQRLEIVILRDWIPIILQEWEKRQQERCLSSLKEFLNHWSRPLR